jgi:hypothetical protein
MLYPSLVLSIGIEKSLELVSRYLADPRNYQEWATGLAGGLEPKKVYAHNHNEATEWIADAPQGRVTIRFSLPNDLGVADHWVRLPDGNVVYVPLRAVANGDGSEVSLTLYRMPGMDDVRFQSDADWVRRDLAKLKQILEAKEAAEG